MTLDTNIIIAYLNGEPSVAAVLDEARARGIPLFLPAAVEAEFLSFSKWSLEQRRMMEKFLEENFIFIPLDRPLIRLAAGLRAKTNIKFADATIAATALFTSTSLATRNVRDFKNIATLTVLPL